MAADYLALLEVGAERKNNAESGERERERERDTSVTINDSPDDRHTSRKNTRKSLADQRKK